MTDIPIIYLLLTILSIPTINWIFEVFFDKTENLKVKHVLLSIIFFPIYILAFLLIGLFFIITSIIELFKPVLEYEIKFKKGK